MRRFFAEFREFIAKGNMLDMAIGIILGTALSGVVNSLVHDILMPPIGLLLANVNFSNLYVNLSGTSYASLSAAQAAGAPTLNYGTFITALINFLIIGLVLFLVVRQVNRMNRLLVKQAAPAAPTTKECPYCRTLIPLEATRCPNCTSELP